MLVHRGIHREERTATPCTIAVLGPLLLHAGDGRVEAPTGRVARLLAWLAMHPNQRTTLAAAGSVIWHEGERAPRHALRELRSVIRTARTRLDRVEGVDLTVDKDSVGLVVPRHGVDADRFSDLLQHEPGSDAGSLRRLTAALALWRGDPYPELHDVLDALPEIQRLRALRVDTIARLNVVRLIVRPDHAIVADLVAMVTEQPDDDRLWRQLAVALHRTGRRAAALRAIHACRRHFERQGRPPTSSTLELERALLDDDAVLDGGDGLLAMVS